MKYPLGPYANDEIAVARHLPQDGRCFAVAFTSIVVVPLDGKPGEVLTRHDAMRAMGRIKTEAEQRMTDVILGSRVGEFALSAINLPDETETVILASLDLPDFKTGEQIQ